VISRYAEKDSRIRPIFKENGGVATALNATHKASAGAIITMLDADDLFLPEKLARVVERFSPGGRVGTVLNTLVKVDTVGREIGRIPEFGSLDRGELREKLLRSAAHWAIAPTSGISFRRECAERVFPIPELQFRTEADGYMCTMAPLFYAVDVIDEPMTVYRVHSSNVTASTSITVKSCERIMSAGERVFAVLSAAASANGWTVTQLEDNPTYCEMRIIRDYLAGASSQQTTKNVRQLYRAADRVESSDRKKIKAKAHLLSLAARLPRVVGAKIIDRIYLPHPAKRLAGALVRSVLNTHGHAS
jgi:glycosyltransferase involved in cell wall biosynthesis